MVRKILGAIAGYIVFAFGIFLLFSALYLALGPDRAFLPAKYDPTMLWTVSAFILGFAAAVIGGFVAALIGRSGAVRIMAGLVLLIGAIVVVMLIKENKPQEVRTGDVPNMEAMMKAREPVWVGVVNPILGAIGVFVGGSLRKKREE
jgi:small-conductance mechanosensitive channel